MPPMGEAPATAAHPPKRKTGVIRAASQNVNGKFRGGGDGVYKDVIRAMGEGKFQIAMLQDTQHAYSPESDYQQGSPSAPLFTHGPPGQAVCWSLGTCVLGTPVCCLYVVTRICRHGTLSLDKSR